VPPAVHLFTDFVFANISESFWNATSPSGTLLPRRKRQIIAARGKVPMSSASDRLRSTSTPDGSIVLNVENGKMFRLNPIGSLILTLLNTGTPIPQVLEEISRQCHIEVETIREDVLHFLSTLDAFGLLDRNVTESRR
jgi:hypothetical protein